MRLDRLSQGRRAAPPTLGRWPPEAADHWPLPPPPGTAGDHGHVYTCHMSHQVSRGHIWVTWLCQLRIILTGCSFWLRDFGPQRQHFGIYSEFELGSHILISWCSRWLVPMCHCQNWNRYIERGRVHSLTYPEGQKTFPRKNKIHLIRYWKTGYLLRLVVLHFRPGDGRLMARCSQILQSNVFCLIISSWAWVWIW